MNHNPTLIETPTIFDYYTETFQLPDGSYVNCEIMDAGGKEKLAAKNRIYYKRADCCLLVYDITSIDSFQAIENFYLKEINKNCKKNIKVILVGNKADLKNERKMNELFEKNTREIGKEISELAKLISIKENKEHEEIRKEIKDTHIRVLK